MLVASGMILAVVFALQSAHEESLEVPVREQVEVPVISQQVYIARDQLGIPTIRGKDMLDTMFGEGFVHGQDRFFQMDIMRRLFAGELSAMIGPSTVPMDRRARYRRPRQLVERLWNALDKDMQTTVQRYCDGVNAGLASLAEPPLEYGILNIAQRPGRHKIRCWCISLCSRCCMRMAMKNYVEVRSKLACPRSSMSSWYGPVIVAMFH